jgi:hypothetical protein
VGTILKKTLSSVYVLEGSEWWVFVILLKSDYAPSSCWNGALTQSSPWWAGSFCPMCPENVRVFGIPLHHGNILFIETIVLKASKTWLVIILFPRIIHRSHRLYIYISHPPVSGNFLNCLTLCTKTNILSPGIRNQLPIYVGQHLRRLRILYTIITEKHIAHADGAVLEILKISERE